MKLTRGGKVIRNLLVTALLAALTYGAAGFPAWTEEQMCRQLGHDFLLPDPVPVYDLRYDSRIIGSRSRYRTFLIVKSGPTYLAATYCRDGLRMERNFLLLEACMANQYLLTPRNNRLFLAGDFSRAASATAVVTVRETVVNSEYGDRNEWTLEEGRPERCVYEGVRENDSVFSFRCSPASDRNGNLDQSFYENHRDLYMIAENSYRHQIRNTEEGMPDPLVNRLDWEIPVEITLYDGAGDVLETLHLTVYTQDLSLYNR